MMPRCDIFCCVIDNLGDVGIAVRLTRALSHQHGFHVRLYIDDPAPLQKLVPGGFGEMGEVLLLCQREREGSGEVPEGRRQEGEGVKILSLDPLTPPSSHAFAWVPPSPVGRGEKPADLVIELLGAGVPDHYIAGMQMRDGGPPVWIRYDYLSAEEWVNDAHLKSSPHPGSGVPRTFFYPGFTDQTGGILFPDTLGVAPEISSHFPTRILMFSYDQPAIHDLADLWATGDDPITLDVSAGAYLSYRPKSTGQLTVQELPFLPQVDFDLRVGLYDLAFIRGEDSFSQAVAAGVPVIWQIYPTEDQAHIIKLQAFCDRFTSGLGSGAARAFTDMQMAWNGCEASPEVLPRRKSGSRFNPESSLDPGFRRDGTVSDEENIREIWLNFTAHFPQISARAREFGVEIRARGSAAQNLVDFYYKSR